MLSHWQDQRWTNTWPLTRDWVPDLGPTTIATAATFQGPGQTYFYVVSAVDAQVTAPQSGALMPSTSGTTANDDLGEWYRLQELSRSRRHVPIVPTGL